MPPVDRRGLRKELQNKRPGEAVEDDATSGSRGPVDRRGLRKELQCKRQDEMVAEETTQDNSSHAEPVDRRSMRAELQRMKKSVAQNCTESLRTVPQQRCVKPDAIKIAQVEAAREAGDRTLSEAEAWCQALLQLEARLNAKQVALDSQQRVLSILAQRLNVPTQQQELLLSPRKSPPQTLAEQVNSTCRIEVVDALESAAAEIAGVYESDWARVEDGCAASIQSPSHSLPEVTPETVQQR